MDALRKGLLLLALSVLPDSLQQRSGQKKSQLFLKLKCENGNTATTGVGPTDFYRYTEF